MGSVRKQTIGIAALFLAVTSLTACGTSSTTIENPAVAGAALLLTGSNTNVIAGRPREIYERVARQATQCWFGPFGSVHNRYIMHADVPPPSSSAPVTIAIHRRLQKRKKPWGSKLLRVNLKGKTTTTLTYQNLGLDAETTTRMTDAFIRWANGQTDCAALHGTEPRWEPLTVSTQTKAAPR